MKLTSCLIFCVIVTLQYYSAEGHPGGLFESIHNTLTDTAHKVHTDIDNIIFPNQNSEDKSTTNEQTGEVPNTADAGSNQEVKPVETTTPSTTTVASATKNETVTEKDGRENFSGSCLPGYQRTPDGRCKPTF